MQAAQQGTAAAGGGAGRTMSVQEQQQEAAAVMSATLMPHGESGRPVRSKQPSRKRPADASLPSSTPSVLLAPPVGAPPMVGMLGNAPLSAAEQEEVAASVEAANKALKSAADAGAGLSAGAASRSRSGAAAAAPLPAPIVPTSAAKAKKGPLTPVPAVGGAALPKADALGVGSVAAAVAAASAQQQAAAASSIQQPFVYDAASLQAAGMSAQQARLTADAMNAAAAAGQPMDLPTAMNMAMQAGGGSPTDPTLLPPGQQPHAPFNLPLSLLSAPQPYFDANGLYCSEPDPFGPETPSQLKFVSFEQLDEFVKLLGLRNGFRHVLRRSHKDIGQQYKHGTYVCEFHAPPTDSTLDGIKPARASSRSIRLACPYKLNFARQGEAGMYHVNKRVMGHSHVIEPQGMQGVMSMMGMHPMHPAMGGMGGMGGMMSAMQNPMMQGMMAPNGTLMPGSGMAASPMPGRAGAAGSDGAFGMGMGSMGLQPQMRTAPLIALLTPQTQGNTPVTEQPNVSSQGCDQKNSVELLRMMREVDVQLFNGFSAYPSVYDALVTDGASRLIESVRWAISKRAEARVIVSGCGTSGRLAWMLCQTFNAMLTTATASETPVKLFHYLCAGGDRALLLSEASLPEDDGARGKRDLKAAMAGVKHVVFIGVSCGLAAPYIAAQVEECLEVYASISSAPSGRGAAAAAAAADRPTTLHTAVLGFTPKETARDAAAPASSTTTFRAVLKRLEPLLSAESTHKTPANVAGSAFTLLTPVVGPEFLTGSTRLKGGSAAKIILESVFSVALVKAGLGLTLAGAGGAAGNDAKAMYIACMQQYEAAFRASYLQLLSLAPLLDSAAASLAPVAPAVPAAAAAAAAAASASPAPGGRLIYLAFSPSLGRIGMIDASEMNDTFGVGFESVRAFMLGGLKRSLREPATLDQPSEAAPASVAGAPVVPPAAAMPSTARLFSLSLAEFHMTFLPTLTQKDLVVMLLSSEPDTPVPSTLGTEDAGWSLPLSSQVVMGVHETKAKLALVQFTTVGDNTVHPLLALLKGKKQPEYFDMHVKIPLASQSLLLDSAGVAADASLASFSAKLLLNALSTGAHIHNGYVLGNRLIHLSITNTKLWSRAQALVTELTQVTPEMAERQLLRAVYQADYVSEEIKAMKPSQHVAAASVQHGVVPLALHLAECEACRFPPMDASMASTQPPAISISQATRQLQTSTFKQMMMRKYVGAAVNTLKEE